ncbi:nineteen complex-related protein 2-domain-containing protein [Apodospora peruviana]|uniref:Nineteen complex-related protein 2-domain-containing protein n=1 Tax=Apodospora peruviana TaxID=516989 RepID=A0AAE0IQQ6_9PEZI|nr:nineteen complex-related protein 2-domain-containing protein [Apodospora peruviana]
MSFSAKRKPRVIQTLDEEDPALRPSLIGGEEAKKEGKPTTDSENSIAFAVCSLLILTDRQKNMRADVLPAVPIPQGPIKFGRNKPAKSSSLRKSINFNDLEQDVSGPDAPSTGTGDGDQAAGTSAVVRPGISRSGSVKQKKRASTSRLSFGPSEVGADDDDTAGSEAITTPKKTLGKRAVENNALRKSASLQNLSASLPTRFGAFGGDEERPRYSKEYIEELQSSTPNTPQNISSLRISDDGDDMDFSAPAAEEMMDLDPSELDGAVIVQSQDLSRRSPSAQQLSRRPASGAHILTEAEIRERKERRARLAKEADFIPLDGSDDEDEDEAQSNRVAVRFNDKPKKSESRLIAEDEDLGEGYDEFVSDGGLALGKKAEREAERRHRQEMAELIKAAEDGSDAESDDSEAERRAAYEAAQRRAGMDGLHREHDDDDLDGAGDGINLIPRMKQLPDLDEVLQRMRNLCQGLEDEVNRKRTRIADLEKEKEEILTREKEVQEILDQAGAKYQAVAAAAVQVPGGSGIGSAEAAIKLAAQSPLRPLPPGLAGSDLPVERGLESFGTPTAPRASEPGENDLEMTG